MSIFRSLLIAAVFAGASAGVAYARNPVFTAKLEQPAAETQVIAQNAVWTCQGDTCVARPNHSVSVRSCRQFVRHAGGRVVEYGSEERQLTADEIARCNGDTSQ